MKAHKNPIQLTIIEDDAEPVVTEVQYRGEDALHVVESQREELMKKLMEVKEVIEIIQNNLVQKK